MRPLLLLTLFLTITGGFDYETQPPDSVIGQSVGCFTFFSGDVNVGEYLIENNRPRRYDGGTKTEIDWEDPILSLTPP